ncbi:unnamed protein product [Schistocephalus solidus]|uniref:Ig-like domain-containing protein n=1 Tax=Schistocephalus solidus TaxID=70667 RepID=A0A183SUU0_SCHSO|nr:unnamed protein product [Schistocephalus solidus]
MVITPDLVSIPPPVSYFDKSRPDTPLTCEVWPPNANVSILSVRRVRQGVSSHLSPDVAASGLSLHALKPESFHQQLLLPAPNSTSAVRASDELSSPQGGDDERNHRPLPSPFSNVALRIQPTDSFDISRLQEFKRPSIPDRETQMTFIQGNVAYVSCNLPSDSQPPPIVHFFHNGTLVENSVRPSFPVFVTFLFFRYASTPPQFPTPLPPPPPTLSSYPLLPLSLPAPSPFSFTSYPSPSSYPSSSPSSSSCSSSASLFSSASKYKYKQIHRPGENRVMLLIYPFKEGDEGVYTCTFRNPITGEEMQSPETVRLGRSVSTRPVSETILLPLAPEDNATLGSNRQIHVREGDNVTLFCIMQASPPPQTRTYPHTSDTNNFRVDDKFGLLHIEGVRPKDAATYICSGTRRTVTAQLVVKPRLRLTQSPVDVRISRFGERAEFHCASSDPQVLPTWLFNGDPVSTLDPTINFDPGPHTRKQGSFFAGYFAPGRRGDSSTAVQAFPSRRLWRHLLMFVLASSFAHTMPHRPRRPPPCYQVVVAALPMRVRARFRTASALVIESVKESDLGIYQCVVRSLTRDGKTDEWVSASAILSLHADEIVSKAADLTRFVPLHPRQPVQPAATTSEMTPRVEILFDNLAVYMVWKVSEETLLRGAAAQQQHRQLYDQRTLQQPINALFRVEYAIQTSQPTVNPALVGLVEPDPPTWTDPQLVDDAWKGHYAFLISPPLKPGKRFRFRVRALDTDTGLDLVPPSEWSETVSTEHISTAPPPKILSVQPYMDDRLNVTWYYSGDSNGSSGDHVDSITGSPEAVFKPDFFLILARTVQRNSDSGETAMDSKIPSADNDAAGNGDVDLSASNAEYGVYQATQVNGSTAREGFIYNLNASYNYQVVVYGVKFDNGVRRITRFSEPFDVILPPPPRSRFSLMNAFMNNKVIFIALGSLALLMLLIIVILIVMCIWRQHKDRRRQRVKQNGFVCGFKESDKYANQQQQQQHQQQQHDGSTSEGGHLLHRPPSPNSKVGSVGGGGGNAMVMDTLMRSNFSEPDQQQKLLQHQHQQQQFAMNTLPHNAVGPMMPAGSAMHLSGGVGGGGFYSPYYPTSQQQNHHHHHHQSHHSLLMSPPPAGTPVFQSGTLPGGPAGRYLRQQQQQPLPPVAFLMGQQQYGSQQVLSPDFACQDQQQASLLRDYYQQQQQQQQQQLYQQALQQQQQQSCMYPGGNPSAFLPAQHPVDTMTRRQSHQSGYYGGGPAGSSISATSLKREAPSGGSMHDACSSLDRKLVEPSSLILAFRILRQIFGISI